MKRTTAIIWNELLILRRDPSVLIWAVIPLGGVLLLRPLYATAAAADAGGPSGDAQAVPGWTVLYAFFLMSSIGFAFYREYGWRTWDRLRSSRASTAEIMAGKTASPFLVSGIQLTCLLVLGRLFLGLRFDRSILLVVILVIALLVCVVSLSLCFISLTRHAQSYFAFANLSAVVLAGAGGALVPLQYFPPVFTTIAPFNPAHWAIQGFYAVVDGATGQRPYWLCIAALLGFSVVFSAVALARFRMSDQRSDFA